MANRLLTSFQTLDSAINGKWDTYNKKYNNTYNIGGDDVVYSTTDQVDYAKKKLELQQNAYLQNRWVKANSDLTVQAFNGLNNIKLMYRDADLMDAFPEIGAALDIVSEEACLHGDTRIKLLNGDIKPIKDLYDENYMNFWCYTVDSNGECKPTQVERVICNGIKDIYEITLDDGTIIKCTDNHKWLLSNKDWIETSNLKVGDSLMSIYDKKDYKGYENLLELKESLFNNRVVSIKKTVEQSNVYDLVNSSVNNSFAVKCNNGHIISHNCCSNPLTGHVVNVYSKSERVKAIIEDLLVNRLDIQVTAPMVIRAMCKYGNQFMLLNVQNKNGVLGWRQLPVYNVDRVENGITNPYGVTNQKVNQNDNSTQFILTTDQQTAEPFRNWQIGHFRLLTDSLYLPYGVSYLHKARRHFRMLSLMEDMMMIYRLERSIERRVYKIYVGAIDDADVKSYVEDIANNFKRTPIVDPLTGQLDLRKNLLDVSQDIFIPTRDPSAPTPIDTLSAAQNLTAMDDIKFVQNKVFTALRIPKTFLNFEENVGDGKNLALMDIRFTRTVNRIQQAFLMELTKIVSIHLYLLGFEDELTNFTLSMNNPSTQAEQLEIDNMAKKLSAVRDAVADPGNGIPIMSLTRALKTIMKWSDNDIKENFEEIRLERGISAELEKTSQIIKKTGIFDNVDRIYGEPGAEYQENSDSQEQGGFDGGSGGFGGGSAPIGDMPTMDDDNVDANLGEEDINGEVGETPISDNENVMNGSDEQPMENRKNTKPLILETTNNRVGLYDKSFLINEEFDKMIKQLDEYIK